MTTLKAFLIASAAAAIALPQAASAQSADQRYCSAMTSKYQQFAGFAASRAQPAGSQVNVAMEQCREGQTAEAIPVLEAALRDANVALPPRLQPVLGVSRGPSR
jgi:hypothetical protein